MRSLFIITSLLLLAGCSNSRAYDPHYIMSEAVDEASEPSTSY